MRRAECALLSCQAYAYWVICIQLRRLPHICILQQHLVDWVHPCQQIPGWQWNGRCSLSRQTAASKHLQALRGWQLCLESVCVKLQSSCQGALHLLMAAGGQVGVFNPGVTPSSSSCQEGC